MNINKIFPYKELLQNYQPSGNNFQDIGFKYAGPILFIYVWWVILEAQKKNIKRLYFIARDGYPLYEIAKLFVEYFNINIECRYLYCSRKSLRTANYCINKDEYSKYLFDIPIEPELNLFLDRFNLNQDELDLLYNNIASANISSMHNNPEEQIQHIVNYLKNADFFNNIIDTKAEIIYNLTSAYFKENELYDTDTITIVDLGWFGSIQKSIQQLLMQTHPAIKIHGFYFGLYDYPSDSQSTYQTFLFDKHSDTIKIWFSPNLLECLCSAPYGQTIGYYISDTKVLPILDNQNTSLTHQSKYINSGITIFAKIILPSISLNVKVKHIKYIARQITKNIMYNPSNDFFKLASNLTHTDNFSGNYMQKIVEKTQTNYLFQYTILYKIKNFYNNKAYKTKKIYWIFGVIKFLPFYKQIYYKFNIFIIWNIKNFI